MKASAVSYQGEEVYPSEMLVASRVKDGLPKVGAGGVVDVLDVTEGIIRHKLTDPRHMLLPAAECDALPDKMPRVWADHDTFVEVGRLLLRSNIAIDVPVSEVA